MIFKKYTFSVVVTIVLTACSGSGGAIVVNDGIAATDSVSLQRIDTLTLNIGSRIRPIPTCSQLLDDSVSPKYIILDEQKLNIFDLDADSLIEVVDVHECGSLQNYSGFYCAPDGKKYLYNYGSKIFFELDTAGVVSKTHQIPDNISVP